MFMYHKRRFTGSLFTNIERTLIPSVFDMMRSRVITWKDLIGRTDMLLFDVLYMSIIIVYAVWWITKDQETFVNARDATDTLVGVTLDTA